MLESLFNVVAGLRPETAFKKMTPAKVFSCELIEIVGTPFLQNTSGLETFKEKTCIGALFQ